MYIITSTCIMIMHSVIQSKILTANTWQMVFMIHKFMNNIVNITLCFSKSNLISLHTICSQTHLSSSVYCTLQRNSLCFHPADSVHMSYCHHHSLCQHAHRHRVGLRLWRALAPQQFVGPHYSLLGPITLAAYSTIKPSVMQPSHWNLAWGRRPSPSWPVC